jgi:THAP domain
MCSKKCASYFRGNTGYIFHKFPMNPVWREQWLTKIILKESYRGKTITSQVICSRHFSTEMYDVRKKSDAQVGRV